MQDLKRSFAVLASYALAAAACSGQSLVPACSAGAASRDESSPSQVDPRVVAAGTQFGLDLLRATRERRTGENVCLSPLSVSVALGMAWCGAEGETRAAMARVLALEGLGVGELRLGCRGLLATLRSQDPAVELTIASSMWGKQGIPFREEFVAGNEEFFHAELFSRDFARPATAQEINRWVSRHTEGRIDSVVDRIPAEVVLYLINAVWFQGKWKDAFDARDTRPGPFTRADGTRITVPLMRRTGELEYLEEESLQAVRLEYGKKGRFSMVLLLPGEGSSLDALLGELSAKRWNRRMSGFRSARGVVAMPRLKMEAALELNDTLAAMGMGIAFDRSRADFSGMAQGPGRLFLDQVLHKTFLEVDEQGTEAAAATSVAVGLTAVRPRPFQVIVDRPFLCAIRHDPTGALLFLATVQDPRPTRAR